MAFGRALLLCLVKVLAGLRSCAGVRLVTVGANCMTGKHLSTWLPMNLGPVRNIALT